MQMTMDPTQDNRQGSINQIENALTEISSLFKKFSTIVAQHEEMVQSID